MMQFKVEDACKLLNKGALEHNGSDKPAGVRRPSVQTVALRFSSGGFTLVEVVICLLLATLIVGGVMGLISTSLQYSQRVREKAEDRPILEAAAQAILADPKKAESGSLILEGLPGAPRVDIGLVEAPDAGDKGAETATQSGRLYRVELYYRASLLEFSIIIPIEQMGFD
jgi:type II secretory pathway pseudopilin PulG